ncbi:hypothetical protein [Okeania sp. SIO2B3]|uniref:hypothetical protein n=1 Tax=Okeania sp. SIO2B3 TaxID=2607784 RepID=UPI0013BF37A0|nr:hypothetical protein [Okeania sp. SIO2B3]NET44004.1 hypothetical protein [Okeania sp. SIO2B3]
MMQWQKHVSLTAEVALRIWIERMVRGDDLAMNFTSSFPLAVRFIFLPSEG